MARERSSGSNDGREGDGTLPDLRKRRPIVRRLLFVAGALIALAATAGLVTAAAIAGVATHLEDAREALSKGRTALSFGNVDEARASFAAAERELGAADRAASGLLFRVSGWLPYLGRSADATAAIVDAGTEMAAAGSELTDAIASLPDGLASLAPGDEGIPLRAIAAMADEVAGAEERAKRAEAALDAAPSSFLLPPVRGALDDARGLAEEAARALGSARLLLEGLPGFAGADRPARYFFGAENPAELRGSGGLVGAYSIVTIRDGRVRFSAFRPTSDLRTLPPDDVPPPSPDYRRNYDQYGGAGFWKNMNMTPDFPSAARAMEATYEIATGSSLDGVIVADPFALEALLEITGPTEVPGLDVTIDAGNVVAFTANEAFSRFVTAAERKAVLGSVAAGVFDRFLSLDGRGVARLRALARMVVDGHLKVYSDDRAMQDGLALARVDGALPEPPGDLLAIVANNAAANKVDYYARRAVTYRVALGAGGTAEAVTTISIVNGAPAGGQPRYVIGPASRDLEPGESVQILALYCAPGCSFDGAERDGVTVGLRSGTELGLPWFGDYFSIPSRGQTTIDIGTHLEGIWQGDAAAGEYRLTFLNQTTIEPTRVRIEVILPAGMGVVEASAGVTEEGGVAVWEGEPGRRLDLEVRFAAPFPLRLWRDLTG
jgi:hypothetical protein